MKTKHEIHEYARDIRARIKANAILPKPAIREMLFERNIIAEQAKMVFIPDAKERIRALDEEIIKTSEMVRGARVWTF